MEDNLDNIVHAGGHLYGALEEIKAAIESFDIVNKEFLKYKKLVEQARELFLTAQFLLDDRSLLSKNIEAWLERESMLQ